MLYTEYIIIIAIIMPVPDFTIELGVKSTCDMAPSDMRIKISDTTWGIYQIRQMTRAHLSGAVGHSKSSDRGQWHF